MVGAFHCVPLVCKACGDAVDLIVRKDLGEWPAAIASLPEAQQKCVSEFLRGIIVRGRAAEKAKATQVTDEATGRRYVSGRAI